MNGKSHAQLLVNDYSGAILVSIMMTKKSASDATKKMFLHAQKLTGLKVGTTRPYDAKELKHGAAKKFLHENGTLIDEIPPYSLRSNGRAKRPNRMSLRKRIQS